MFFTPTQYTEEKYNRERLPFDEAANIIRAINVVREACQAVEEREQDLGKSGSRKRSKHVLPNGEVSVSL